MSREEIIDKAVKVFNAPRMHTNMSGDAIRSKLTAVVSEVEGVVREMVAGELEAEADRLEARADQIEGNVNAQLRYELNWEARVLRTASTAIRTPKENQWGE